MVVCPVDEQPSPCPGPKPYMDERGLALLDAILAGDDPLYDPGAYPNE
jgi:hypothetical protein